MKTNKILLATILAMFVLAVLPVMSATALSPIIYAPLNNTNHTDTVTVTCNVSHDAINVTAFTTADYGTTNVSLGALTNTSVMDNTSTEWSAEITLTSANDAAILNITCYADNGTDQAYSTSIGCRGIMFDSTDPACSLIRLHRTFAWKGIQKITWTSSDTNLVSTAVTIDRPEDGSDMGYTDANKVLTLTSQDTKYIGDWTVTLLATDGATNTCTETVTFRSYLGDGEIWEPTVPKKDTGKTLLLIAIVAIVAWFIFKKK